MRLMRILVAVATLTTFTSAMMDKESGSGRLHRALFKRNGDDLLSIPISRDTYASVRIKLYLRKIFEVREREQVLVSQLGLDLMWNDKRLTWNASKFDNISHIVIKSDLIWKPDIVLRNSASKKVQEEIVPATDVVRIYSDGRCYWWPFYGMTESHCSINTMWFPFDEQHCHMVYSSWQHSTEINFMTPSNTSAEESGIYLWTDYEPSDEWEVTGKNVSTKDGRITFSLHLRRLPLFYVVNHIIPCCLLSFIAVLTITLPPSCVKRLGIIMSVLLALTVYQLIISDHLPTSSRNVPVIVWYFMFVLSLCVVSLISSIFVLYLDMSSVSVPVSTMPAWMKWLLCTKLASCLRMNPVLMPVATSANCNSDDRRDYMCRKYSTTLQREEKGIDDWNFTQDYFDQHSDDMTLGSTDKLLMEIRDLLREKSRKEVEDRDKKAEDEDRKNDWKLAAAVVDRIFLVLACIFFIGETAAFIAVFAFASHA